MITNYKNFVNEEEPEKKITDGIAKAIQRFARFAVENKDKWFPESQIDNYNQAEDQSERIKLISTFIDTLIEILENDEKISERGLEVLNSFQSELVEEIEKIF